MSTEQSPDFPEYDRKTVGVWKIIAEWWDNKIGDGNLFQDYLIEPSTERLLQLKPGGRILDIPCGAGHFARRMVSHGIAVLAIDHSEKSIKRARNALKKMLIRLNTRWLMPQIRVHYWHPPRKSSMPPSERCL